MGEGEGGLNRDGGLLNFPPLKTGGLLERGGGGLNTRGFTVYPVSILEILNSQSPLALKFLKSRWLSIGLLVQA